MGDEQHSATTEKREQGTKLSEPERTVAQDLVLSELAKHGNIKRACKAAHIDRSTFYRWKEDEDFEKRYKDAMEDAKDAIRDAIYKRAVEGVEVPVFQQGMEVGTITKYSDTLLIFHAKMLMPEYRDNPPPVAILPVVREAPPGYFGDEQDQPEQESEPEEETEPEPEDDDD